MTMEVDSGSEVSDPPPAILKVSTDSESGIICLPLEYEEKELEKTPLPREVVLTEGVDHPILTYYTFSSVHLWHFYLW